MWKYEQVNVPPPAGSQPAGRVRIALSFRNFDAADQAEVVRLLSIGRPTGYLSLKSAVFNWQFQDNPHSDGRSPFLIGVLDDRRIVALNGYMPARIRFHHQPLLASWSCDTYVSPEYRGQGFGTELVRRVSNAAPVMLGYGISDMSDPIFARQDWLLHPGVELLFYHVAEAGLAGRAKNLASRLARRKSGQTRAFSREITCEDHARFSTEVNELWTESRLGYASTVERDADYLNWKYYRHPINRYISFAARCHGQLQGLLIALHDPVESVIADYCGPANDVHLMGELVAAAVEDLGHRRTVRIRCETTHGPMIDALHRAGFLGSRHASRFRVRSNIAGLDALDGWFLMTGDSDNDILSALDVALPRTPTNPG